METGVTTLYYSFREYLKKEEEKLAVLSLTGRIEDYLVKEFCHHVYDKTNHKCFALTNTHKVGEQKIDICLLKNKSIKNNDDKDKEERDKRYIYGMIEAKYFRNKHRLEKGNGAEDEITTNLQGLKKQLKNMTGITKHYVYDVKLSSRPEKIYGLVFAVYAVKNGEDKEKAQIYYKTIMKKANDLKFRYVDNKISVQLDEIFKNVDIDVMNDTFSITLKTGLWILR